MGKPARPRDLRVPSEAAPGGSQQQQVQEQRRRINAMLQDYRHGADCANSFGRAPGQSETAVQVRIKL